ncbi:TauD/TfdA family dioxygenase [Rhodococcus erythropolis]|uniref:TauD/TfdA dioxygenase family protein n=1 Tax=Rhodococcus erythropolis TaxID=1833 RepID=UPI0024B80C9F|nr:TauD/TfdA family dioxygenase [Rhodococcus erythropolis]MDJ0016417.1 TauD/TfdA family dioxygenase [Rhodococcus erythropolis]MDJ0107138.1 TauD/TfdA family dioxygenase [Rhodococcus erythropolis]
MSITELERVTQTPEQIYAAGGITVHKVGELIGARIDGVHLSGDLSEETAYAINYALAAHKVVFFRGQQHLDDTSQYEFAGTLGSPTTTHPTLKSKDNKLLVIDGAASSWHTDVTFIDRIPKASILRATTIPEYGGATTWASTTAAYNQLPHSLKVLVENLRAVHTNAYDYAETIDKVKQGDAQRVTNYSEFTREIYETEHPVVRVHPATGEKTLLLGHFVKEFVGLKPSESVALYQLLQARIIKLENTVRWSWAPGDVAIWDNQATQHYGISDYGTQARSLHRVTLAGDVPVDVHGEQSRIIKGDASEFSIVADIDRLPGFAAN